jgi:hypothetical protein
MAFGNIQRVYADSLNLTGSWVRGSTSTVAGGVFFNGTASSMSGQFQYYGTQVALIGAAGTSCTITLDGISQASTFNGWLGSGLSEGFHTLAFNANTGTTRIEAIDFLRPSGELTNKEQSKPLPVTSLNPQQFTTNPFGVGSLGKYAVQKINQYPLEPVTQIAETQTFTTDSSGYTNIPNANLTMFTTGRPVLIIPQSSRTNQGGVFSVSSPSNTAQAYVRLLRDDSQVNEWPMTIQSLGATRVIYDIPSTALSFLDLPPGGTHIYQYQWNVGSSSRIDVSFVKATAVEL